MFVTIPPLIQQFEKLDLKLEGLDEALEVVSSSKISLFIIYYPHRFYRYSNDDKLVWIWNHFLRNKLFESREIDFTNITNTGSGWQNEFFQKYYDPSFTEPEIDYSSVLPAVKEKLLDIMQTKDILVFIPNAIDVIKKEKESFQDFVNNFLVPISKDKKIINSKGKLLFIFVQNFKTKYHNIEEENYSKDVVEAITTLKPFLIRYQGFLKPNEKDTRESLSAFEDWLSEDESSNRLISGRLTKNNKIFANLFKIYYKDENGKNITNFDDKVMEEYLAVCSCGTIEKLFERICNEFGYELRYDNKEYRWAIAKKNQVIESSTSV